MPQGRTDEWIRLAMISLGCPKNLVDSEKMLASLAEVGCAITPEPAEADVILVNTCGFLQAAKDEVFEILDELQDLKRQDPSKRIVLAGCLVQREGQGLLAEAPFVDAIVGVHGRETVAETVLRVMGRTSQGGADPGAAVLPGYDPAAGWTDRGRLRLTPQHYAYLRISEGCDQKCTFCTIPAIRGPFRSKPPEEILAEANELAADGATELIVIGQDTTRYGADIGYESGLAGLLTQLNNVPGVSWLRLMYTYPRQFDDRLIDAIAACDRVVKYVDMPLQHINDQILRRMGRRSDRAMIEGLLGRLRERAGGIAIRTTFIVGFPGETESQFDELLAFVRQQCFDAAGVFAFSPEPGTPAADLDGQIDDDTKQQRLDRLMLAQQQIAFDAARASKGRVLEVVVDGPSERAGWYEARHGGQAPEVDSLTRVASPGALPPGTVLKVRCTGSDGYDLLARPLSVPGRPTRR